MAEIGKGKIIRISKAIALLEDSETKSLKKTIQIPERMINSLKAGDTIAYAYFNDLTGIAIEKIGGD
jgi:hypothetical protein